MSDPPDDESVAEDCRLFRRITRHHLKPAPDHPGGVRLTRVAFQGSSDGSGVSVSIEDRMLELSMEPSDLIAAHSEAIGLAFVLARTVRELGKGIVREPTADDPTHGALTGPDDKAIQRSLSAAAEWEIPPDENP